MAIDGLIDLRTAELGRNLTTSEQIAWFWRPVAQMVTDHGRDATVYAVGEATQNGKASAKWMNTTARAEAARRAYVPSTVIDPDTDPDVLRFRRLAEQSAKRDAERRSA